MKNPPWERDELILALDLYFRHNPSHIGQTHPEVRALSRILNTLPIHQHRPDAARFRNANGVHMKLCNFLRLDPTYSGRGLSRGGVLEEEVWREFANDRQRLSETAAAIRARVSTRTNEEVTFVATDEEEEFPEGRILFRAHRSRERKRALVERAKRLALRNYGHLACQACGFDFEVTYGAPGQGFIECHHLLPVSHIRPGTRTRVTDIALLCSNCHRMVHRRRPWLSMEQLTSLVRRRTRR